MRIFLSTIAICSLAACMPDGPDVGQAPYGVMAELAGKTITNDRGRFTYSNAGALTGTFDGKAVAGTWWQEGDLVCRSITIDGNPVPDDCQSLSISGDQLTIVRQRGTGTRVIYTIT